MRRWIAIVLATLAAATAFAGLRAATAQVLADGALRIDSYASGMTSPSFFEFLPTPPGAPLEFLVCEIGTGRVKHYRNGGFLGTAVDLNVAFLFERGLFGIALDPVFPDSAYVYLFYTASNTGTDTSAQAGAQDNRVVRLRWTGSQLVDETLLLTLPVGPNHNGGALAFGPDGMLYGSIGEAGSANGQLQNVSTGPSPDNTSIVFRIRRDGSVPPDNPFAAVPGMEKVYAYGLRNVFGIDFDPLSGRLWNTDNGASTYDEINHVAPGMNGGWRRLMGPSSRNPSALANLWSAPGSAYVDPRFSFFESFGITAIHFLRGDSLGAHYAGDLFVAAHNSASVYHFDLSGDRDALVMPDAALEDLVADTAAERDRVLWASDVGVITDIGTGPDGALYLLRFSTTAQMYRVTRPPTSDLDSRTLRGRLSFAPNPFRDGTWSRGPEGLALRGAWVHAVNGARVRFLMPQASTLHWDGRDAAGRPVAAGVYFVRHIADASGPPLKVVRIE